MDIDYCWVGEKVGDKNSLKKYCVSDREVEFCWWLCTEVVDLGYVYKTVLSLLEGKPSSQKFFRGDVMRLSIDKDNVFLENPVCESEFEYSHAEFENALLSWAQIISKEQP